MMELKRSKWNCFCLIILLFGSQTPTMCTGQCVSNCSGLKDGDYQSCDSCEMFITCANNELNQNSCPGVMDLLWDDAAKKCLRESITCGEDQTDGTGNVVCNKEELKSLCPTPTDLRLERVYQLKVQNFSLSPDQYDEHLLLSDVFKKYDVCKFRQRSDMIGVIQFIPEQLFNPTDTIDNKLQWESANTCHEEVATLYHLQYDCEQFVIPLHQETSITGNYIIVTNSFDIYESYFYSTSMEDFTSWLTTNSTYIPQHGMNQFCCELTIKQDTTVIYGEPQSLLRGNVTFIIANETSQRTYSSSSHPPQGDITATDTDRAMILQFIGASRLSSDVLIIPFKVVGNERTTVKCGLLMDKGTCMESTTEIQSLHTDTVSVWNDMTSSDPGIDKNPNTNSAQLETTSVGVIVGSTLGTAIIIATATVILLFLIHKRKNQTDGIDCIPNPLKKCEPSNCNATWPKENNLPSYTPVTGSAMLPDAVYAKLNKPGVHETIPDNVVIQTSTVDKDGLIVNDVYNSDVCRSDKGPVELIDNEVYEESTMAKEHDAVKSYCNDAITDGYEEPQLTKEHDTDSDDKNDRMKNGQVYINLQSTTDLLTGQCLNDMLQFDPEEIKPRSKDNSATHVNVSRESCLGMVENSIYNQ